MVNVIHHHHQNPTEHYFCYINHPLPEAHYRVLLADVAFGLMFCCLCSWKPMKDWQPHHALWLLLQPVQEMNSLHNKHHKDIVTCRLHTASVINTLNTELNPICHLLALLGAHHILHVSRIRVKTLLHGCQA